LKELGMYLGADPGASGGLARVIGSKAVAISMPETDKDILSWLEEKAAMVHGLKTEIFAVLEKVGGYTQVGGPQPGSAMFKFGTSYGGLRMALTAARIPFEEIMPQKWQRGLGIVPRKKGETKSQFKSRLKDFAQKLFPDTKVTLAIADALLIALYCQRKQEGKL
jgi:hypothetical protein